MLKPKNNKKIMAKNTIPTQLDQLFPMAKNLLGGLNTHGKSAGVLQHTATRLNADLTAARTAENLYQNARAKRQGMAPELKATRKAGETFLTTAKNVLRPWLGQKWNTRWAETGLVTQSQRSPKKHGEKEEVVKTLAAYFTAYPAHESATHGITAARATELYDAIVATSQAVRLQDAEIKQLKQDRDAAVKQLKRRMRGLIQELKDLLPALDSRWTAFGLNAPGAITRTAGTKVTEEVAAATSASFFLEPAVVTSASHGTNGARSSASSEEPALLSR